MKRNLSVAGAVGVLALLLTAAFAQGPTVAEGAEVPAEIVVFHTTWMEMWRAGQIEELMTSLYTEDAVTLPANAPRGTDPAMRLEFARRQYEDLGWVDLDVTIHDGEIAGDVAYETGDYTFKNSAGETTFEGKYLWILERVDGDWKIKHAMFSSNRPATGN